MFPRATANLPLLGVLLILVVFAAAAIPVVQAQITPASAFSPTNNNESYRIGPVTNDTEFYSNDTGQTPSTKR